MRRSSRRRSTSSWVSPGAARADATRAVTASAPAAQTGAAGYRNRAKFHLRLALLGDGRSGRKMFEDHRRAVDGGTTEIFSGCAAGRARASSSKTWCRCRGLRQLVELLRFAPPHEGAGSAGPGVAPPCPPRIARRCPRGGPARRESASTESADVHGTPHPRARCARGSCVDERHCRVATSVARNIGRAPRPGQGRGDGSATERVGHLGSTARRR